MVSDEDYQFRDKRSVDEMKEDDVYESHPTTTSCSTDKEN